MSQSAMHSTVDEPPVFLGATAANLSGKRKHDDDDDGIDAYTQESGKRQKSEAPPSISDSGATAGSSSTENASSVGPERANGTSLANQPHPEIRLVVKAQRGGEMDYVDPRERYIMRHADAIADDIESRVTGHGGFGIAESFDDLDEADLDDNDDVEGDMIRFKTEYDVAIQTKDGVEIGQVKLVVVDLTESEDFCDFFDCIETLSPTLADFAELFDNEDEQSGRPLLDSRVKSTGTTCWTRREFTRGKPLVLIDNLEVKNDWRGRGVGSQVYATLSSLSQVRGSKYLFAKPAPVDTPGDDEEIRSPAMMDWIERGRRIRAFHRNAGFRRIGNSMWYARSFDPTHPSRAIAPEKDAPFVPPGKLTKQERQEAADIFG